MSYLAVILVVIALAAPAKGTSWAAPTTRIFESANKQFQITIEPGVGPAKPAEAIVSKRSPELTAYIPVRKLKLRNLRAPVMAVITNDGHYLVTFEDWAETFTSPNAVVIYDLITGGISDFQVEEFPPPVHGVGHKSLLFDTDILHAFERNGAIWLPLTRRSATSPPESHCLVIQPKTHKLTIETRG